MKQTYVAKDKKDKNNSRYISVNKDVNESYSHHLNMDGIKNVTPM